jgi:hypothetical protein
MVQAIHALCENGPSKGRAQRIIVNDKRTLCRVVFKSGLLRAIRSGQACVIKSGLVV